MNQGARMLALTLLVAVLSFGCNRGETTPTNSSNVAFVLFDNFETVLYARGDLLSGSRGYGRLSKSSAEVLRGPFAALRAGLDAMKANAAAEILPRSEVVFVGARDFRSPDGLGGVQSEFCYVVVLPNGYGPELQKYFGSVPKTIEHGMPAWISSVTLGEEGSKPVSFFATQLLDSSFLVCSNKADFQTMARRLSSVDKGTSPKASIRDWEFLSNHRMWAYRRYRHNGIVDRAAAGMTVVSPGAEALLFAFEDQRSRFVLRLFCSPSDETTPAGINAGAVLPRLKQSGPGVWETTFPFVGGEEETSERLFVVMGLFGFGVYL
jgi:hypothetical protein